jgi:hypothetical protein
MVMTLMLLTGQARVMCKSKIFSFEYILTELYKRDWVGISVYWKGYLSDGYPMRLNKPAPSDFFEQMIMGGPQGSNTAFPFYTNYCTKYNKPFVMAEGGAAWCTSYNGAACGGTATQVQLHQSFWASFMTVDFFKKYPKIKMLNFFEFIKPKEDNGVDRDYRNSIDPAVRSAFQSSIASVKNNLVMAGQFVPGVDPLCLSSPCTSGTPVTTAPTTATATVSTSTTKTSSSVRQILISIPFCLVAILFLVIA